jgi:hypothetical protein
LKRSLPIFLIHTNGYSVNFSKADDDGGGIRWAEFIGEGKVSPLIFVHTIHEYLDNYLGTHGLKTFQTPMAFVSEHRLLTLTSGKIFVDHLNLKDTLKCLRHYPEDVRL